jgi:YVTN family beta-propeller protein
VHQPCRYVAVASLVLLAACQRGPSQSAPGTTSLDSPRRLPTGRVLDPAGTAADLGSMPLAMTLSPDGRKVLVLLNGYREQGVQVVDRATGRVDQTLVQVAAFLGLAFSPDGRTLYASGGNQDVVYRYAWRDDRATLTDSLILAVKRSANGTRYPGGIAVSPDGTQLYVAENLGDSLAVIDLASARVVQRLATERYPFGVVVAKDGTVYVSAWGGSTVSVFARAAAGSFAPAARIRVGRHPSAMLLGAGDSRLFVASASTDRISVIDTKSRRVLTDIYDSPPGGPGEGSTPGALALSGDGTRLFLAEADNNAVALVDLAPATSGVASAVG